MHRVCVFTFFVLAISVPAQDENALPANIAADIAKLDARLQAKTPEIQVQAWTQVARVLRFQYPNVAEKYALRAEKNSDSRDAYGRAEIYKIMLDLDPAMAASIGGTVHDKNVLFSAAMRRCQELKDAGCGVNTLHEGFHAGAFHITGVGWTLDNLDGSDSKTARQFFEEILGHFPKENAGPEDLQTLLDAGRSIARLDPGGARKAAEAVQATLKAPGFEDRLDQVITGSFKTAGKVVEASTTEQYFQIQIDALQTNQAILPLMTKYTLKRPVTNRANPVQLDPSVEELIATLRDQVQSGVDFGINDLSGKTYSLRTMRGRAVLVNFWATWCGPCRAEMPELEALNKEGVPIFAITDEEESAVRRFLRNRSYSFPVLLDTKGTVFREYQVIERPTTLVVDSRGQIVRRWNDLPELDVIRKQLRAAQR